MAIKVLDAPVYEPETDVIMLHGDMLMIKRIKDKGLYIDAIKVARMFTKCSLRTAKEFVDSI